MCFPAASPQAPSPLNAVLACLCGESSTLQKTRKAFKRAVGFTLFKDLKIPVQCSGSGIKPLVSVGSASAREMLRTGTTTFRQGLVWERKKRLISWQHLETGPR